MVLTTAVLLCLTCVVYAKSTPGVFDYWQGGYAQNVDVILDTTCTQIPSCFVHENMSAAVEGLNEDGSMGFH